MYVLWYLCGMHHTYDNKAYFKMQKKKTLQGKMNEKYGKRKNCLIYVVRMLVLLLLTELRLGIGNCELPTEAGD